MARLTREQLEVYRTKRLLTEAEVHLLDTIAELERDLESSNDHCLELGKDVTRLERELGEAKARNDELEKALFDTQASHAEACRIGKALKDQLSPGPCGKHPMWAWRRVNSAMPEAIRTPDHCILCEEVQAAEAAALERAAQHKPMIAITGHKKLYTWIYCSCGFNKEYATHTTEPEAWSAHIRNLTPSSAGAQAMAEGVADSGRKIAETAIRSDVQLGDHYAGYRGPCPHVSEHIECLHFMFKEFVPPSPCPSSAGAQATSNSVTTPPVIAVPISEDYSRGYADGRLNAMTLNEGKVRRDDSDSSPAPVPASGGSPLVDYSEYQKKHRLELKERDETIARLRDGFTWAMSQLDDTQELRDQFGLICVQCKPVNNEHAIDCKLVKYRALLDQAQGSTQQRSGNAPTGSWASGEREGRG